MTIHLNTEAFAELVSLARRCAKEGPATKHDSPIYTWNQLVRLALQANCEKPEDYHMDWGGEVSQWKNKSNSIGFLGC